MALGSLVVRLGLDAAEFLTGLTKAELQAKKFEQSLERGIATAARAAGIGVAAIGTAAIAAAIAMDRLVKQAAEFKDLEEKTGASAEALASFAVSAAVAGTSMGQVATSSIMLTKNLVGVSDESKAAGAALTALGIPIKAFKALDPAAQMEAVARALAKFADGSGKTAVAIALFGRAGAESLPFLKELGQEGGRQVILTQRQIELADEYADKQARLVAEIKLYAQAASTEALPAINALAKATRDFIGDIIGLDSVTKELRNENAIATFAENSAKAVAFLADAIDAVAIRLPSLIKNSIATIEKAGSELLTGQLKKAADTYAKGVANTTATLERTTIQNALENALAVQKATRDAQAIGPPEPKGLKRSAAQGGLPSLDDFAGRAAKSRAAGRVAISEAQRYLESLQKQLQKTDELSAAETVLADIRSGRLKLSGGITQERLVGIAQQIDEAKALKKSLEEEVKAREANSRATLKAQEAAIQDVERMVEQNVALRDEIALIDADVAARKAIEQARISSAIALKQDTLAMLENAGASPALIASMQQQINLLRERGGLLGQRSAIDQGIEDATKAQRAYGITLDRVGLAQRRIDIAQESGAITSLEALRQRSDATKSYIGTLQKQLAATEALARLEINPIKREDALHRVEQMRVELEALAAQGDLVAKKFNDIFAGSFANSLSDFIDGTKSAKEAFKDFAKSVTQQINQIASQNISEALFGKGGIGGGIGGIFSSLFGGGKAATKGADPATVASALTAKGLGSVTVAAETAASALLSFAGKTTESFSNLLGNKAPPAAALDTSAFDASLSGLGTTTASATFALENVARSSAATTRAMTPLSVGFANLNTSTDSLAGVLGTTSKDLLADLSNGIFVDTSAFNAATASSASALSSFASTSAATDLALTPLTAGFSGLSTATNSAVSTLLSFESSKDALSNLFGSVDTSGAVSADASLISLSASATTTATALTTVATTTGITELAMTSFGAGLITLTASAQTAAAALLQVAGSKGAGAMGDLFSEFAGSALGGMAQGGGFAKGGDPPVGKWSLVGEKGPELFMPKVAGTIVPNHKLKAGVLDRLENPHVNAGRKYSAFRPSPEIAKRRIDIADESGTTLQSLRQRSNATKAYIGVLQKQLATVEALARAEVDPLKRGDALSRAEQLNEQIEALLAALANIKSGGSSELFSVGGFSSGKFGHFAAGGVPPVGRPSWVGERGPELFVPKMAGTIISNHALKTIGGDTVNIVNNIITAPAGPSSAKDASKDFANSVTQQIASQNIVESLFRKDDARGFFSNLFNGQSKATTSALATVATTSAAKDIAFTGFIGLTAAAETAAAALLSMSSSKNVAAFTQPTAAASRLSADFDRTQAQRTTVSSEAASVPTLPQIVSPEVQIVSQQAAIDLGPVVQAMAMLATSEDIRAIGSQIEAQRSVAVTRQQSTTALAKKATGTSAADASLLGLSTTAKTATKAVANTSLAMDRIAVAETAAAALLKVSEPAASALAATRVMATTAVRASAHARTDTQALAASVASNTVAGNDRPVGRRFTAKQQAIKNTLAPILADLPQAIPSAAIANAITLLTGAAPLASQRSSSSVRTIVDIDAAVADAKLINRREQTLREFVPTLQPSVNLPQVLQADAVELGLGLLALAAEKTATALLSINASKRLASARPGADLSSARLSRQPLSALPDTRRQNVDRLPFEYVKQRPAEVEQVRIAFRRDVGHAKIVYGRHVAQAMMQPPPQPASWLRPQADRALISLGRYTPPRAVAHVPGLPRASVWRSPGVLPGLETLSRAKPLVPDAALLGLRKMASSTTAALTTVTTISAPLSVGFITLTTAAETAAAALLSIRVGKEASVFNVLRGHDVTGSFSGLVEGRRGFMHGGNPPVGVSSWVGEHGRELFVPKVAGTIVPNKDLRMGGDTISNAFYFNLPPNTTSQSASQMALEVGRRVSQVMRRKN